MKSTFDILKTTRDNIIKSTAGLSEEQWNHTPAGFNNNIIWNFAHVLVTQQLLCYKLSGNKMLVSDEMVELYKKGSKPGNDIVSLSAIDSIKNQLVSSVDQLQADYKDGKFKGFQLYPTSYGFPLSSIDDAITFNNTHEGMHYGSILALKNLV